jgi:hypothetical protein
MTPEGRTKKLVKEQLRKHAIWQWWPVPSGYGASTVDCIACWNGRFTAIECKREGITEPTPRQAAVMKEMRKAGAITYLATIEKGELKWIELR